MMELLKGMIDDPLGEGSINQSPEKIPVLENIIKNLKPTTLIEIGFNKGYSCKLICDTIISTGNNDVLKTFYVFDICKYGYEKQNFAVMQEYYKNYNIDLKLIEGDSKLTVPHYIKENNICFVDFIEIDGGHTPACVSADWNNVKNIVNNGGIIYIDDYYFNPELTTAIDNLDTVGYKIDSTLDIKWFTKIANNDGNNRIVKNYYINMMYQKACQTPTDIYLHLPKLMEYAFNCLHVTEMGVREAVSIWAFVKSLPQKLVCYDIYRAKGIDLVERICKEVKLEYEFKLEDTTKTKIEQTDFLFIDTLHTYEQLSKELELHAGKVNKFLGFHDTETFGFKDEVETVSNKKGLMTAINEFLEKNPEWVIDYQTKICNGLTILKRKE